MQINLFSISKKAINFIGYLAAWIINATAAVQGHIWLGLLAAGLLLILHFKFCDSIKHEIKIILLVTLLGGSIDSALCYHHLIIITGANPWHPLAPPWMWTAWLLLGTILNSALSFLQKRLWLAANCGLIDVPIGYLIGYKIGLLHFPHLINTIGLISLSWVILMPIAVWVARPR